MTERTFHYCEDHKKKFWDVNYCPICDEAVRQKRREAYAAMPRFRDPRIKYIEPFEEHKAENRWQTCNCQTCQEKRFNLEQLPGPRIKWGEGPWK